MTEKTRKYEKLRNKYEKVRESMKSTLKYEQVRKLIDKVRFSVLSHVLFSYVFILERTFFILSRSFSYLFRSFFSVILTRCLIQKFDVLYVNTRKTLIFSGKLQKTPIFSGKSQETVYAPRASFSRNLRNYLCKIGSDEIY